MIVERNGGASKRPANHKPLVEHVREALTDKPQRLGEIMDKVNATGAYEIEVGAGAVDAALDILYVRGLAAKWWETEVGVGPKRWHK